MRNTKSVSAALSLSETVLAALEKGEEPDLALRKALLEQMAARKDLTFGPEPKSPWKIKEWTKSTVRAAVRWAMRPYLEQQILLNHLIVDYLTIEASGEENNI